MVKRNERLRDPLSEKELLCATKSASRYTERYGFGSAYIARTLGISEDEMDKLDHIASAKRKKEIRSEYNKSLYDQRLKSAGKIRKKDEIKVTVARMKEMIGKGNPIRNLLKKTTQFTGGYLRRRKKG